LVFELLRKRVGSPVSYTSIAEDAGISPNTVKRYIEILEALYIVFRVTPYSKNIARSLLKEPKIYFFDTGLVQGDEGIKMENFVAICLLKHVLAKIDGFAENYALHYLQTKDRQEVDFVMINNEKIETLIEVKLANSTIGLGLSYFHNKYGYPAIQIVKELKREKMEQGIKLLRAQNYLETLYL